MKREVRIYSYFTIPTDLAAQMRDWTEFVSGQDYAIELKSAGETVSVRFVEESEQAYVSVSGTGAGTLFDQTLGRIVYALSAHSDNLIVSRRD